MMNVDQINSLLIGTIIRQKVLFKVLKETNPEIYEKYLKLLNSKEEIQEILNDVFSQFWTKEQIEKIKIPENFEE